MFVCSWLDALYKRADEIYAQDLLQEEGGPQGPPLVNPPSNPAATTAAAAEAAATAAAAAAAAARRVPAISAQRQQQQPLGTPTPHTETRGPQGPPLAAAGAAGSCKDGSSSSSSFDMQPVLQRPCSCSESPYTPQPAAAAAAAGHCCSAAPGTAPGTPCGVYRQLQQQQLEDSLLLGCCEPLGVQGPPQLPWGGGPHIRSCGGPPGGPSGGCCCGDPPGPPFCIADDFGGPEEQRPPLRQSSCCSATPVAAAAAQAAAAAAAAAAGWGALRHGLHSCRDTAARAATPPLPFCPPRGPQRGPTYPGAPHSSRGPPAYLRRASTCTNSALQLLPLQQQQQQACLLQGPPSSTRHSECWGPLGPPEGAPLTHRGALDGSPLTHLGASTAGRVQPRYWDEGPSSSLGAPGGPPSSCWCPETLYGGAPPPLGVPPACRCDTPTGCSLRHCSPPEGPPLQQQRRHLQQQQQQRGMQWPLPCLLGPQEAPGWRAGAPQGPLRRTERQ